LLLLAELLFDKLLMIGDRTAPVFNRYRFMGATARRKQTTFVVVCEKNFCFCLKTTRIDCLGAFLQHNRVVSGLSVRSAVVLG
jgi:hypothetical protein